MSSHEVTLDQRPSVSVLVDGQRVATLQLGLSIVFDVNALLLGISTGQLTAVRSGRCEITATLAVQGTDLLVRHAHLELPGVIPLRRGIRLLPTGEYPPGEYTGREPTGGMHTGSGHQGNEYPAERDAPGTPVAGHQTGPPAGSPDLTRSAAKTAEPMLLTGTWTCVIQGNGAFKMLSCAGRGRRGLIRLGALKKIRTSTDGPGGSRPRNTRSVQRNGRWIAGDVGGRRPARSCADPGKKYALAEYQNRAGSLRISESYSFSRS